MVRKAATVRTKAKEKKNIVQGVAHIKSTFNNTIVSITDATGAAIPFNRRDTDIDGVIAASARLHGQLLANGGKHGRSRA